jgi:hypothetical protein
MFGNFISIPSVSIMGAGGLKARYGNILEGLYTLVDGTEFIDLMGGTSLTLSVSESEEYLQDDYAGTITAPAVQALIDGDDDELWFTSGTPNALSISDLVDSDYSNTFVKYSNSTPYNVYMIGIIKDGVSLTQSQKNSLSSDFHLWIYYFGGLNDYGYLKDNRDEGSGYTAQYQAVYDSLTSKPSEVSADAQNTMVSTLITAGLWSLHPAFWFFAQDSNSGSEALPNWISPGTNDCTLHGDVTGPTFIAKEGLTGVPADNAYIHTHFNPSTDGGGITSQDSLIMWFFLRVNDPGTSGHGVFVTRRVSLTYSGGVLYYSVNTGLQDSQASQNMAVGLNAVGRRDSANHFAYVSNTKYSAAEVSTGEVNADIWLLARNQGGPLNESQAQIAAAGVCSGSVTDEELNTIEAAVEACLDANGKGVLA